MKPAPTLAIVTTVLLAACAAPPNTPGAGSGETYTPVIDMQGANSSRYGADLEECRNYAKSIKATEATLWGGLVGGLVGASIASSYGLRGNYMQGSINTGVLSGMNASGGKAVQTQEQIIRNCMAGRGYRTLDGAAPAFVYPPQQQPQPQAIVWPTTPPPPETPPPPSTTRSSGQWSYVVEHLPAAKACHPQPQAAVVAKGPGNETYAVSCASGDILTVKCEYGNCRALK